jgi:hypothetical protein
MAEKDESHRTAALEIHLSEGVEQAIKEEKHLGYTSDAVKSTGSLFFSRKASLNELGRRMVHISQPLITHHQSVEASFKR